MCGLPVQHAHLVPGHKEVTQVAVAVPAMTAGYWTVTCNPLSNGIAASCRCCSERPRESAGIHREYSDALFVQTHRDPVSILVSMSNLAATVVSVQAAINFLGRLYCGNGFNHIEIHRFN